MPWHLVAAATTGLARSANAPEGARPPARGPA